MLRSHRTAAVSIVLIFGVAATIAAEETGDQKVIVSIERIWDRAAHSAFTDLIEFRGRLYCTFREGTGHIPGLNGVIRVIASDDRMRWESVAMIDEPHVDLRDPKISITPDGRLMLNTGASYYEGSNRVGIESRVIFSDSQGTTFGKPTKVVLPESIVCGFDWLWRVTWHDGWAWGAVQQLVPEDKRNGGNARQLKIVRSRDAITWELVSAVPVEKPSETTLRFTSDGTLLAMIRHDSPRPGYFGHTKPPFTDWSLVSASKGFGGPNLVQLPGGAWLVGSRDYDTKYSTTALLAADPVSGTLTPIVTLPSKGDNSYPGIVIDERGNRILVSYYSSHEEKTAIYLATLRLDAVTSLLSDTP